VIKVELSTLINQSVERVFAYTSDFTTLPEYDRYVVSCTQITPSPIGVGTRWTHRRVQGRRRIEAPIEMIEFETDKRFVMKSGSGPFDVRSTMVFEAQQDGATKVTEVLEMRIKGPLRLMEPMIRRQVGPQGHEVHAALKAKLEQAP
jgi:uncharacterized membrane protein